MCTGLSEANGSWKTSWTSLLWRRKARAAGQVHRLAVEHDRARGGELLPGQQPGHRRLARAALADQRDHGPAVQAEADVAHGVQRVAAADPEVLAEGHGLHGGRAVGGGHGLNLDQAAPGGAHEVSSSAVAAVDSARTFAGGTGVSGRTNGQAVTWYGSSEVATLARLMSTLVQASVP